MKIKSSVILKEALVRLTNGTANFVCAAIQDVETDLRYEHNENITSKASQIFSRQMPKTVREDMKIFAQWWNKGDPARLEALQRAIIDAESKGD